MFFMHHIKNIAIKLLVNLVMITWLVVLPITQISANKAPTVGDFVWGLSGAVFDRGGVSKDKTLIENVAALFYPWGDWSDDGNRIYKVIRNLTLWIMIIFIVRTWASLLFNLNKKSEDMMKALRSVVYMIIWWAFVYWASWIFWDVLNFAGDWFRWGGTWLWWMADAVTWADWLFFHILAALKWFAFFLAILMIVITWVRVIIAGEKDKWKKLVKGLINVVVALVVIKGIDFIYYMAMDAESFITNASDFIINAAKLFWYGYWIVIVIMVFVAWYLYLTDWGSWNGFKKACNILVNIVLSALVLFSFLFILYQVFAEFWPGGQ